LATNALFANVLTWVKSQIGGENYQPKFVSVHSLVNEIMLQTAHQAKEKNIIVVNEMAPDVEVYADPDQLKVVFRNLISNAVKYSFPGGAVRIGSYKDNDFQVFTIHDKGKGIDEESGQRLFTEIKSLATGTSGESGSGLGLLISKEMLEKGGGRIWFESSKTKGTTFFAALPIKPKLK
jgi:signal transduction histidine kinase